MRWLARILMVMVAALALSLAAGPATAAPTRVYTGVYVTNVQDVNLNTNSFVADFYVWFRWKGAKDLDPAASLEFMNQSEAWGTIKTDLNATPERRPDGSWYSLTRYQSRFNTDFPLQAYPFSTQYLVVEMESGRSDVRRLVFVADRDPVGLAPDVELSGYSLGAPSLVVSNAPYTSTFGDPAIANPVPYSRITVSVPISRPVLPYALKIFLPMLIVVICAGLVFLIDPSHVDSRFAMGLTSLLTVIAIKWVTDGEIPNVNYLTLVDALFLPAFGLALISLATAVWSSRLMVRGHPVAEVERFDRRVLIIAVGGYVLANVLIFWAFLG